MNLFVIVNYYFSIIKINLFNFYILLLFFFLSFLFIIFFSFFTRSLYSKMETIINVTHCSLIACHLEFNNSFVRNSPKITNILERHVKFRYLAINPTDSRTEANISLYQHKPFRFFITTCRRLQSFLGNGFAGIPDIPR